MKLLVLTFSTDNTNPGLIHLTNSLKKFNYDYVVLNGPAFSWAGNNLKPIANWLKDNCKDYTHFLYTDAWDTIALAPPDELMEKYRQSATSLLYSAEKNCYPRSDWSHRFTSVSRWRYLNAGGYIAPVKTFLEIEAAAQRGNENDQEYGSALYLDNPDVGIDDGCEIFQTLYMEEGDEFAYTRNGRLFNRLTNTYPVFVHGNGKVDMRWLYHPPQSPFYM